MSARVLEFQNRPDAGAAVKIIVDKVSVLRAELVALQILLRTTEQAQILADAWRDAGRADAALMLYEAVQKMTDAYLLVSDEVHKRLKV